MAKPVLKKVAAKAKSGPTAEQREWVKGLSALGAAPADAQADEQADDGTVRDEAVDDGTVDSPATKKALTTEKAFAPGLLPGLSFTMAELFELPAEEKETRDHE